jgi:membrane protease YdiL (CAAX protease family)
MTNENRSAESGLVNFGAPGWTFILYVIIASLQEFLARGVCLTSIERNISGKFAAPAVIILMENC